MFQLIVSGSLAGELFGATVSYMLRICTTLITRTSLLTSCAGLRMGLAVLTENTGLNFI